MTERSRFTRDALVFLFLSATSLAQVPSGGLRGVVRDESDAVIPKAEVSVTNSGTGFRVIAPTNSDGTYAITALPAGEYVVRINADGFRTSELRGIVSAGVESRLDGKLSVGGAEQ